MKLYESIMWQYIAEEPQVLANLLKRQDIKELAEKLCAFKQIYFISHGSSYNSSMTLMPFYARYAKVNVHCITAGNFIASEDTAALLNPEDTLVVCISQTGNSRGTLLAAELAKKYGLKTVGIAASTSATLKKYCDEFIELQCGEEDSNAKTKGMSSTLLTLALFGTYLGYYKNNISEETVQKILKEFELQVEELTSVKEKAIQFCKDNDFGKGVENFYIIGSSMNYGLALEAQIKLMETMCIPTCAVDTEEFSHGTHRAIHPDTHVLVIRSEENKELADKTFKYLNNMTNTYMIETFKENNCKNVVQVENHPYTQSILTIVEFIQVISAYGPENNGLDPNRDANNDFTDLVETRI